MSSCARSRDLFGPYWDDEITQAEREWLEGHFASCQGCRESYEQLARTLEAVAALPREEAAPDLAERALAAARRTAPAPDRIFVRETPVWMPVTAGAATLALVLFSVVPMLQNHASLGELARRSAPIVEPHMVGARGEALAVRTPASVPPAGPRGHGVSAATAAGVFDHAEDVDFVLDPVTLRRGRAHTASHAQTGSPSEQAVISY